MISSPDNQQFIRGKKEKTVRNFKAFTVNVSRYLRYSKTCVKWPLSKRQKIGFQDQLSFNAGQKCCRMLQGEHSAILLTCIKLPFFIKIFVFVYFWWAILHRFYCTCIMYIEMIGYLSKYTEVLYEEESILNFTINPRFFKVGIDLNSFHGSGDICPLLITLAL